jgi:hypothetical protein
VAHRDSRRRNVRRSLVPPLHRFAYAHFGVGLLCGVQRLTGIEDCIQYFTANGSVRAFMYDCVNSYSMPASSQPGRNLI